MGRGQEREDFAPLHHLDVGDESAGFGRHPLALGERDPLLRAADCDYTGCGCRCRSMTRIGRWPRDRSVCVCTMSLSMSQELFAVCFCSPRPTLEPCELC